MRLWWATAVGLLALAGGSTSGQVSTPSGRPAFRGSVDVVPLTVTVTDGARRHVTDLEAHDFQILEDGRPQEIAFFQRSTVPLVVGLLLDTSASMDRRLPVAQKAASGFVRALGANDVAMAIDFDNRVRVRQSLTADTGALSGAIAQMKVGGSTALYNAVYVALKELNKQHGHQESDRRRKVIVLLSDGEDTSSIVTFDEVLELATRSDTAIYCIGLLGGGAFDGQRPQDQKFALRQLAERTGGRAFFPQDMDAFSGIYAEIKTELSNQYSLAYESNNPRRDGQFRRISIRVSRNGASARTRSGYYAASQ
ncbi:MAG TPA: VWA domain-containing protein [Vicinamibacterales bacterium]|nr:VWA domain-containing protein [Vicinamibacterales bacterium]